jgi:hypothetical protein
MKSPALILKGSAHQKRHAEAGSISGQAFTTKKKEEADEGPS